MERFDIVVYGATGFTGRLAAEWLARHAPAALRLAIAGRSADKLDALRASLSRPVGVIVADSGDPASLDALARQARVIASTAGPFALYSDGVVAACVAHRTDYVDITGETTWARSLIERFHERAAADGTRIVPFCGFDSVPSDLGAWAVVDWIRREWSQPTPTVTASFAVRGGGFNGGTVASALLMGERGDVAAMRDPLLLVPADQRGRITRGRLLPGTSWDFARKKWLAPFLMQAVNTRIVARSAALFAAEGEPYAESFAYDEAMEVPSRAAGWGVTAALGGFMALAATGPGRSLVRRFAPAPGEGPTAEQRERGSVRVRVVGEAADGRRALATLSSQGDAGNVFTVRALSACALALALDRDRLPKRAGLLTPATAFGAVLVERLREAGMTLEVGPLG